MKIVEVKALALKTVAGFECLVVERNSETDNLNTGDKIVVNGKELTLSRPPMLPHIYGDTITMPVFQEELFNSFIDA